MSVSDNHNAVKGRFAPSPSGRMHLGNVFTALVSWLSAKSRGGKWLLRIEDLDPQRSKIEYARLIEDDLRWLGLEWDEGGLDDKGNHAPYSQSLRGDIYCHALDRLKDMRLTYPCRCTRADIMATQAPHESDGRIIYQGTCRPAARPPFQPVAVTKPCATRLYVPDKEIQFTDGVFGCQSVNLTAHCGDFVLQRADGAWAYQLAVVVDDALMGVTEVVRGCDLLLSTAQQLYLYDLLDYSPPRYIHLPLLSNPAGQRLSKRDMSLSMQELRRRFNPEELIGRLAGMARIKDDYEPCTPNSLLSVFDVDRLPKQTAIIVDD
ncbi:MAG: tRNA glutamyl-Q(34) synthetase GluQRS [Muribaculaceae bacterium]|nr:tRNA glutamyl-Q(34) synthetase GluQRS [Muribaculaceae bacterium]